jgi:GT2 family glycosyltransferase
MRMLGHIHALNDEEVIDRSVGSLMEQTYPLDEILLVDNGSTDSTLERTFPDKVTIIREKVNGGTSGAVFTGMRYAIEKNYDWIYILDADSVPHRDALEKLVALYQSFPPELQATVWRLSSLPVEAPRAEPRHGVVFTPRGCEIVIPDPGREVYECDSTIWSGSLYKMAAVRGLGLPNPDYVLDWGEYEYGYLGKQRGYRAFVHQGSTMDHSVCDKELPEYVLGIGPLSVRIKQLKLPAIRLYYIFRNTLYFWVHIYYKGNFGRYLLQSSKSPNLLHLVLYVVRVLFLSEHRRTDLQACARGVWDGLGKKMQRRY